MIRYLPSIYEGELLSSWIMRAYTYSPYISSAPFRHTVFLKPTVSIDWLFYNEYSEDFKALLNEKYGMKYLIEKHTLVPFYSSFFTSGQKKNVMNKAINTEPCITHYLSYPTIHMRSIKYCPLCLNEHTEPYFVGEPQIIGMNYCPIHKCKYRSTNILLDREKLLEFKSMDLIDFDLSPIEQSEEDNINIKVAKHYYVNKYNLNFVLNLYYEELAKDKKQSTKKKKTKKNLWGDIRLDAEIGVKADDYERIDDIYNALFQLYPQMLYFINEAKELNKNIPYEEEKIHFYPSLKIDSYGTLKKVGIRANSLICQYTSYDKQIEIDSNYIKDEKSKYREDYLDKRLGKNYEEFDVRASVPRVARAMHCNQPMGSMKEDIYNTLFGDFVDDYNKCFDTDFQKFEDKEVRRFFKMMFMILYFGGSPQRITEGILKREKVLIGIAKKYEKEQAIKENRKPNYEKIKQPFNNLYKKGIKTIDIITKWQQPLLEILNAKTDKDTSVFMDESCIYMLVYKSLKEMGIDVIQVYDGFYFPKGTQKSNDNPQGIDMEQLVNDAKDVYLKLSLAIKALVAIGGIAEGLKTDATDLTKYLIDNMGEIQKTIKNQG